MTKDYFLGLLLLFLSTSAFSQLVNIESRRMQTDSIRFVFSNDLSFSYYNTNGGEVFQISDGLSTQLKSKDLKKIYLLLGNYNLVRASDQNFNNSWFLHLRFNYKITNLFRFETFVQSQYNELLVINSRNLFGLGGRLKLIDKDYMNLYFGNAYMYEFEKSDAYNHRSHNHRHSTYISFNAELPKSKVSFLNTMYYQPLYKDFSNYILMEQFKVVVPLVEHLKMFTLFNYYYDSITPSGDKQFTSNLSFGLNVTF